MKTLVTDLFTYLRDALGEAPEQFTLTWHAYNDNVSLDDIKFSRFDKSSEARLALLGGELQGDSEIEGRIFTALQEIANFDNPSVNYPNGDDGHDEVGFRLLVLRDGRNVTATITVFDTVLEPSDDTQANSHEMDEELLALLAEKKVTSFKAEYNGGGDSGERSDLIFETSEGPSKDPAVEAALDRFVDKVSGDVSIDWYNNEGGGGEITWQADSDTPSEAESSFYYNEEVEVSKETEIVIELPEDFQTTSQPSIQGSSVNLTASD